MPRINTGWFIFKNENSLDKGVRIMDPPSYATGMRRGSEEVVSGRNGYIWNSDETREQYDIKRVCRVRASRKREVQAWLSGDGPLIFSTEQDARYDAQIINKIDYKMICPGEDPLYEFIVTFTVQPNPYLYPDAVPIPISESGFSFINYGTAPALPRVEIIGNGDFSLTIGMETMFFTGISGGIVVDSELMDALSLDGAELLNNQVSGTPFEIQPGENVVQWLLGDGANIERVTITPRWRYI